MHCESAQRKRILYRCNSFISHMHSHIITCDCYNCYGGYSICLSIKFIIQQSLAKRRANILTRELMIKKRTIHKKTNNTTCWEQWQNNSVHQRKYYWFEESAANENNEKMQHTKQIETDKSGENLCIICFDERRITKSRWANNTSTKANSIPYTF